MTRLQDRLSGSSLDAARALLGQRLCRTDEDNRTVEVRIVEVEAYDQLDPASHTFRGQTPSNRVMFEEAGLAYVYFTYGMHHCVNVVAGPAGDGAAVLLRAAEVIRDDHGLITDRRGTRPHPLSGPARLTQGLAVTRELDGTNLFAATSPLQLINVGPVDEGDIASGPRVGVRLAADIPWRLWIRGHSDVSNYRRHPKAAPPT